MKLFLVLLLILSGIGCRPADTTPVEASGNDTTAARTVSDFQSTDASPSWVNRVWTRTDTTGLPGVMRIFLADGTLVMDSCWETYRLANWEAVSDSSVTWQEDTATIEATLVPSGEDELQMRLFLVSDTLVENYRSTEIPYVCPDMVR